MPLASYYRIIDVEPRGRSFVPLRIHLPVKVCGGSPRHTQQFLLLFHLLIDFLKPLHSLSHIYRLVLNNLLVWSLWHKNTGFLMAWLLLLKLNVSKTILILISHMPCLFDVTTLVLGPLTKCIILWRVLLKVQRLLKSKLNLRLLYLLTAAV